MCKSVRRVRALAWVIVIVGCGGEYTIGDVEGAPAPICDPAYTQRARVQVDARPYVEALVDFPVLVTLTPDTFDYGGAGPGGEGLRFTDAECGELRHEIDRWDPTGTSQVWVSMPSLAPGAVTDLFLFFGEASPSDTATPNEVFASDFAAVYHFEGEGLEDASAARRTGANRSSVPADGWIGGGRDFDSSSSIAIPDAGFSSGNEPRTACMWARSDDDGRAYYWMFAHGTGSNSLGGFAMNRHGTILECLGGDGSRVVLSGVFDEGDRDWRYVCCTYDGSDAALWIDGVALLVEEADWPIGLATGQIGSPVMPDGGGNGSWRGGLDEVRVSRVARSADWIAAEHASMTGAMVTLGAIDTL